MPARSLHSAGARFLDRESAVRSLRQLSEALVCSNADVAAVVLFGSLARGDHGRRSDADLLVCLRSPRADRPRDRIPTFLAELLDAPVPVDVFPFTESELCARLRAGDRFLRRALVEGIVLAGSPPDSVLRQNP